jgi:hypothetical protein
MKKMLCILVVILATGFAFAQDGGSAGEADKIAALEADVTKLRADLARLEKTVEQKNRRLEPLVQATVQTSFGVDLNTMATGFNNSLTSSFKLSLVDDTTRESVARGDLYGYIKVTDYGLELSHNAVVGSKGSVEAYLKSGKFYTKLWGKPSFTMNAATAFDTADAERDVKTGTINPSLMGITLGYSTKANPDEAPEFALRLASKGDLTGNINNDYMIGWVSELEPVKNLFKLRTGGSINMVLGGIEFNQDPQPAGTEPFHTGSWGFYINPELSRPDLAKGFTLGLAFDGNRTFDNSSGIHAYEDFAWDANLSATLKLSQKAIRNFADVWSYLSLSVYFLPTDNPLKVHNLDAKLSFYEIDENDGFIPGLGLGINLLALNLLDKEDIAFAAYGDVSYKLGKFKPYAVAGWNVSQENKYDGQEQFRLKLGLDANLVQRATFYGEFGSTDLLNSVDGDRGYLSIGVKVSY